MYTGTGQEVSIEFRPQNLNFSIQNIRMRVFDFNISQTCDFHLQVRSFSQLRNEFADVDTFYLATGPAVVVAASPIRRSRSRPSVATTALLSEELPKVPVRGARPRSKSRPRILYAPDSEILQPRGEYTMLDLMKEEPTKVTIRGLRRTFYPPVHHAPADNTPPDKKLQLAWV